MKNCGLWEKTAYSSLPNITSLASLAIENPPNCRCQFLLAEGAAKPHGLNVPRLFGCDITSGNVAEGKVLGQVLTEC